MSDYIRRESRTFIEIADDLNDLVSELNDKIVESIREKNADAAPIRHGHWIYNQCDIVCSECGTAFSDEVCYMMRSDVSYHEPKHCLWCGARMDGDENEDA